MSIASILAESASRRPDHIALALGDVRLTYRQTWDMARRVATVLQGRGVEPGDRVAIMIPNVPQFPVTYYGIVAAGATVVPVHALLTATEIEYVLRDSGAKQFVCAAPLLGDGAKGAELAGVPLLVTMDGGDQTLDRLEALAAAATPIERYVQREAHDVAAVLYTSGTTGQPKGAMLTHLNVLENVNTSVMDSFDIVEGDTVLAALPLFHSFGQTCVMHTAFRIGGTLVLVPRFEPQAVLELMAREGVNLFLGVPTMFIGLLEAAKASDARPPLRCALSGGAALPVAVLERFGEVFGCPVYEGYGLTETSPVATFNQKAWPAKPGTVGRAIWGVDVAVASADVEGRLEFLPTGERGEVVIRGHNIMKGYLNKPEATAEVMVDGWFRTGDIGILDPEGYLSIVDRKKDLIIRGGFNVYPREVEEVLSRMPGVAQVAVIGLPDATLGEEVCAVVVRDPQAAPVSAQDVVDYARERLGRHKYPRRVEFTDAFPLGPSGKVLKREMIPRYSS